LDLVVLTVLWCSVAGISRGKYLDMSDSHRRVVMQWLGVCILTVFAMVVLGGAVRLTGSGLSMVDWRPLMGIFPPMGDVAWNEVFDQYKQYPEYQLVNQDMLLADFKFIFYMEYFHRLLGRMVGLVFFIPFSVFLLRRMLPAWLKPGLWIALGLGACQGLMGWYMVKSGLVDDPHVSQYRLTAHLLLAVIIYAWLLRLFFALYYSATARVESAVASKNGSDNAGPWVLFLILLMIATGGFMAGTKAGFIYNTWPTMGAQLVPEHLWGLSPWWRNLFENTVTIQFIHRWLAFLVLVSVVGYGISVVRADPWQVVRRFGWLAIFFVSFQVVLGIATLLTRVPVLLGVTHQGVALLVLGAVIAIYSAYRPIA